MDRRRRVGGIVAASAVAAVLTAVAPALGQGLLNRIARKDATAPPAQAPPAPAPAADASQIQIQEERRLVNPNEPIALVNGEPITRDQLATECVARKGEEILETLIARKLIDQAIRKAKIEVSAAEVDAEIERVAQSLAGVSREKWLATLAKERKISPAQYARDIIYPALALRKLAGPQVQVTEGDIKEAFEAQFGARLRCRMILLNSLAKAKEVWEQLKKNPSMFEKLAQDWSIDPASRSLGGMLPDPIARHAYPRTVSDAAFAQLVDVDPHIDPKSPDYAKYAPKDGDVSGIIQVTESTWVILRREGVLPARPYDAKDPGLRQRMQDAVFEAKVQEKIGDLYAEMLRQAAIENLLTGQIKAGGSEELGAAQQMDLQVKRMSAPDEAILPAKDAPAAAGSAPKSAPVAAGAVAAPGTAAPAPAAISSGDAQRAAGLAPKRK